MQGISLSKTLAVMLAFLIVLGPASAVLGVDSFSYGQEAQLLHDLGLYNGIDPNGFDPDLGATLNRETGVVMMLRLFGLETNVLAMHQDEVQAILNQFTDASDISTWARPFVAYAVSNGLVTGLPNKTFGPKLPLTGNAYATLLLRQLGYNPLYSGAAGQLGLLGVLTPQDMEQFANKPLIKDDLVGISYGTLTQLVNSNTTMPEWLTLVIEAPAQVQALAGVPGTFNFTVAPADAEITIAVDRPEVVAALNIKKMDNGACTLEFAPLQTGTAIVTITGTRTGCQPASKTVEITVASQLTLTGLDSSLQVEVGSNSLPFGIMPGDASVSAVSSNSSVVSELDIKGTGSSRTLNFAALEPGGAVITVKAAKAGFNEITRTIAVTVIDRPFISGLEGPVEVGTGAQSLPFTVYPADTQLFFIDCDSDILSDIEITKSSGDYSLDFQAGSPGTANITLLARKSGYIDVYHNVQVNVVTPVVIPEGDSGSEPSAVSISGLDALVVSGATLQYVPFSVDPADATLAVSSTNVSAIVSGATIVYAKSEAGVTTPMLCFEPIGDPEDLANITVTASRAGYDSASQTIDIWITPDPVTNVIISSLGDEATVLTGLQAEIDDYGLEPSVGDGTQIAAYYIFDPPGTPVLANVSIDTTARQLLYGANNQNGAARIIVVAQYRDPAPPGLLQNHSVYIDITTTP